MIIKHAYEGILNEIKGIWTDECPDEVIIEKELLFLTPDNSDHVLKNKETKEIKTSIIIENETETENWEEIEREKYPWEKIKEDKDG